LTALVLDGSRHSGSGTLVRFGTALAAVTGRRLHVVNARVKRDTPGLRPQHVAAVRAAAELCGARVDGVAVGSDAFRFEPGGGIRGGEYAWDIGTAGSATMLALGILPIACFADGGVTARITGGVFQDFAPSPHHMQHVLAPLLARMGATVEIEVVRPGYVPRGGGVLEVRTRPVRQRLEPLRVEGGGVVRSLRGIALASHLADRNVAGRMAATCSADLLAAGLSARIERVEDTLALHAGASLALWAETGNGGLLGADRAGAPRRTSESIGHFVARALLADLATAASTDRHAADQLIPFAAVAAGRTRYLVPAISDHVESNLWLAEQFGAATRRDGLWLEIDGLALERSA
jgi:RNA 3'-terminal phosphate cyclase (ATP)